jgi:pimeloyl-ACP methyl ester carboxylesterase
MSIINVNGLDIHYQTVGEGPDIVMVHGLAANLAFWYLKIVPMLAKDYRVTVYDLRGHGLSGLPREGYTTKDMAEDLRGLFEKVKIERAHIFGHSLGGAICLHFTILYPGRVDTLSLVDCRIHALQPFRSPKDISYWLKRREELRDKGISISDDTPKVLYVILEELAPLLGTSVVNPNALPGLLVPNGVWDPKSRAALRWKRLASSTTFSEDLMRSAGLTKERIMEISQPTLLTYGGDSFCLPTCHALQNLLSNQRTVIHPGLGHFYPAVAPELVVRDFREFHFNLERHPLKQWQALA